MKHFLFAMAAFVSLNACAQGNQRASPHETVATDNISVTYGRPYKKGREVLGGLEKFGNVWRLGADEATTITFKKNVKFAGKPVKAGTYTMFAIPKEKEWTIILNSQLGQWGAFKYNDNKDKDVLQVNVAIKKLEKVVEQLTIRFPKPSSMVIEWDQTQVTVPIQ